MADQTSISVDDFRDLFGKALRNPDKRFDPYRALATKLRNDPQYKDHIDPARLAEIANKELNLGATFTGIEKEAGGAPPPARPKAGEKAGGGPNLAVTQPLLGGAQPYIEKGKEALRGVTQWDPSKKEHTPGELFGATGQVIGGVMSGLAEAGIQLTSPANIAAMIGSFGIDKIKRIPGAARAIIKLASGGALTAEMARDLVKEIPEAKAALDAGDAVGFGDAVGRGFVSAMMGYSAGKGVLKEGFGVAKATGKAAVSKTKAAGEWLTSEPGKKAEAPKAEAPAAPKAEAPPAAEQIAGLPPDQLEVAHTKAVQQADKLRLSVEKANVGLRGAESRLRSLQERKDNLELGTTPAKEKDLANVEKDLAAQTEHVEKLKARHAEIADQHRQWQDAATAARTRGQQMKAPWAGASEAPPEARREHTAPIPEARRIESARQPMAATGLPPALPPPSRPEMAKDVGVPIAPYPPTARPAPPEIPKALPAPSGLPSTPPAGPQVMAPEQIQAIAQKHGVRPSELADLAQQDPRTIGTNLLKLMQARKTLAKQAPAGGAGAPGAAPVETMEQINGRIAAYQEILKAKSPGGAPPKEQPPQKGTAPPEVRAATETKEPVAETKAPKTETKPAAAEPPKMVAPTKLSSGVHYTVEKDNDLGLYPGDDVVYGGTSRGKHSFTIHEGAHRQVILIDAKDTPIEDVMKVLGEPAPPPEPRKAKGKKKEGPKHQRREEPDKDSTATDDPGFFGKLKNKAGELIHEGMQKIGVEDKPEYSEAYSRLTHQPLIVAKDPKQFEELAPGDVGATFFKAGDLGVKSGPLGNVVREQLGKGEGPISVVHPDVEKTDPMLQSGVPTHEAIHQFVGEKNPVPVKEFMDALPPNIADRIRQHRSGRIAPDELGDELPARLGASGLGGAGGADTDPRKTQEYSLGLNQEEAKQAWNVWLDLYAKKDPKKAAKLRAYTGGGAPPETREKKKQPVA